MALSEAEKKRFIKEKNELLREKLESAATPMLEMMLDPKTPEHLRAGSDMAPIVRQILENRKSAAVKQDRRSDTEVAQDAGYIDAIHADRFK